MEINFYREVMFLIVVVYYIFNIEYFKSLKMCFKFLEEYIFGIVIGKKIIVYSIGVRVLMSIML